MPVPLCILVILFAATASPAQENRQRGRVVYTEASNPFGFLHEGRKDRKELPVTFFASFAAFV
ncbi:hypothetical protein OpiT1DRAFT_00916 [Opitutaceae bacterium TAV1]|nr:hypothetical protein OpiT1DRAFT_00916 [Opitutaceae bacterium TAV1]